MIGFAMIACTSCILVRFRRRKFPHAKGDVLKVSSADAASGNQRCTTSSTKQDDASTISTQTSPMSASTRNAGGLKRDRQSQQAVGTVRTSTTSKGQRHDRQRSDHNQTTPIAPGGSTSLGTEGAKLRGTAWTQPTARSSTGPAPPRIPTSSTQQEKSSNFTSPPPEKHPSSRPSSSPSVASSAHAETPAKAEQTHTENDFSERVHTPGYVPSYEQSQSGYASPQSPPRSVRSQAKESEPSDKEAASKEPIREVEEKMRNMMDRPLLVRKKTFKELLVENHPDKNSSEHAKEVFQTVNNARDWFLLGEGQDDRQTDAK